jgi:DNA polymerase-3 subunit delta
MNFAEAYKIISQGKRYPVYLLFGPEDYETEQLEKLLVKRFVTPEMRDFNYIKLFGSDISDKDLVSAAGKYPMMAEYQCVVCTSFDKIKISDKALLAKFFADPVETTVLILRAEKIDKRTTLYKEIQNKGFVFEAKKKYENQIVDWIVAQVNARGGQISRATAEILFGFVGTNLRELDGEIEKILLYLKDEKNISDEDVSAVVGFTRELTAFELANAIAVGNFNTAYKIGNQLLQKGEALVKILSGLYFQFNKLWQIAYLIGQRKTDGDIASELKLSPFFLKRERKVALRISLSGYHCIMKNLAEFDRYLKTTSVKDSSVFGRLLLQLHKCLQ